MKVHSNGFKQQIKLMGKEIDSKITIGSTVLGKNELNAVTPSYQGALLKSVMKELHIDSNVDIPLNSVLNYKFGVKVNGEYEYIDFGNYVVYKSEKQEDTRSYNITCYDKMLYSMKEYEDLGITYPITIRDYIKAICDHLGLAFASYNDNFANSDKEIPNELYLGLGYTFRDVFDELSQVTASTICLNDNDEVEVRYITETNDVIDEEYLKDVNVNFGEKYGKINSIVLSRSAESDNVYLQDEDSVRENGLCELKIIDNQIMNFNNRSEYLPQILNKLNGLEYYINDFTSTGITYYDLCDRYSVKIGDKIYSCVMFNDEINVTQGLEEIVYTEMPKETQTDYTKADKTDRKINQTQILVDKQNNKIELLSSQVVPVSNTIKGVRQIQLENAYEGRLHKLSIKGNISLLYPSSKENLYGYTLAPSETLMPSATLTPSTPVYKDNKILYPSNDLFSKSSVLLIDDVEYKLDFNFLNYINDTDCDEFIYEDGKCKIIRRVGVDADGNLYATGKEVVETKKDIELNIKYNSTIKLKSFDEAILETTYLLQNEYTDNFITEVDAIARINLSPGEAKIQANKIKLEGYTTINNGFSVDLDGNMTANNGRFNGGQITLYNTNADAESTQEKYAKLKLLTADNENLYTTISSYSYGITNVNSHNSITSNAVSIFDDNNKYTSMLWADHIYLGGTSSDAYMYADNENTRLQMYDNYSEANIRCGNDPYFQTYKYGVETFSSMTPNGVWSPSFNNNSLESKKKNIDFDDGCLQEILDTDICSFNWKSEDDTDQKHIGCIINDDGGNYKVSSKVLTHDKDAIDLYSMCGMSWKAIQELYDIIKLQEQKIKELEERLNGVK